MVPKGTSVRVFKEDDLYGTIGDGSYVELAGMEPTIEYEEWG